MDDPFKLGAPVRQRVEVVSGVVADTRFNPQEHCFEYLVEGGGTSRWFLHSQLEAVPEQPKEGGDA